MPHLPENWWEEPSNFPCMLTTDSSERQMLVWVHYAAHGNAYDCRDNMYRLTPHTNWRRATKEEIILNIKGI